MENEHKHKWLTILFFSISGLVFGASLYLITVSAIPVDRSLEGASHQVHTAADPDAPRVKVVLQRDAPLRLDQVDIIYRGIENRKLRLDVIVLELDPQYAYRHAIALDEASRGFRLAGIDLQLLAARDARAKLVWHRNG
jgi:hypothetical protein